MKDKKALVVSVGEKFKTRIPEGVVLFLNQTHSGAFLEERKIQDNISEVVITSSDIEQVEITDFIDENVLLDVTTKGDHPLVVGACITMHLFIMYFEKC